MKNTILFVAMMMTFQMWSQQINLEECYKLVTINYPLAQQSALLDKQNDLDLKVIGTEKLPQLEVAAQATYQSDVIEIPIPNSGKDPINKDQYRATISANQLIYGGGIINASLEAKNASLKTKQKQLEVSLYQLKSQINQLYFSILLLQEKRVLLTTKKEQLEAKLKEIKSGIANGILLPTSDKVLEAELIKIQQQFTEIDLNKNSLTLTLASLIGKEIGPTQVFQTPDVSIDLQTEIKRPELELFQLKKNEIKASEALISKQNSPKLIGFAQGGYGNPGLNMLDNSFQPFYTVGVKLNWNPFDWNATQKKRRSLSINKDLVANEAEIFNLNTNIALQQQKSEIEKIEAFIESDALIIQLRKEVLKSAESQFRNGVITSSAYITELTNLYEDENTLSTHKMQLLLAKSNYRITKGK